MSTPLTRAVVTSFIVAVTMAVFGTQAETASQEVRRRWETADRIRREKFDLVLPAAMREYRIDMWITVVREGREDPLFEDLGRASAGYWGQYGYYVFTDRGGPGIERAALGLGGYTVRKGRTYDIATAKFDLRAFVAERDPKRIAVNVAEHIGALDGMSHTEYRHLLDVLGEPYASRVVSAEAMVAAFRSRRVATEIAAMSELGELSRRIVETALSNEVITPGVTSLEDVGWWMQEQIAARGLTPANKSGLPSIYLIGPDGIGTLSGDHIIQRGDLLTVDFGASMVNLNSDLKRIAYVLRLGETAAPPGFIHAFERAAEAYTILRRSIAPGQPGTLVLQNINRNLSTAGFKVVADESKARDTLNSFAAPSAGPETDVLTVCHSIGNLGHDVGPSLAVFNPYRLTLELRPTNFLSIELFAWTPAPEWGGRKVQIHLEDDAVVTERGVEWLYPPADQIRLIR